MSKPELPPEVVELLALWKQWMTIIHQQANRHRINVRRPISPEAYKELHATLMKSCRELAKHGDETKRELFRRMADRAEPWMGLENLKGARYQILNDLTMHCVEIDDELRGRTHWNTRRLIVTGALAAALFFGIASYAMIGQGSTTPSVGGRSGISAWVSYSRSWMRRTVLSIRRSSFLERFSIITVIVVVVGIILGTQQLKRWG